MRTFRMFTVVCLLLLIAIIGINAIAQETTPARVYEIVPATRKFWWARK